jgi:hypothetical protein
MRCRDITREIVKAVLPGLLLLICYPQRAWPQNKARSLAAPEELQAPLGARADRLRPQDLGAEAQMCVGQARALNVILRLAKRTDTSEAKEANGMEIAKKMGLKVAVKTFGPVTCSTTVPPSYLAQYGLNTTCSVFKNGQVAAVEVTAKASRR